MNEPLNAHFFAADSTINFIAEAKLTYDQKKVFEKSRKVIVGICEDIIQMHDKYYFTLSAKNIEKEAEKEYYAEFEEGVTKEKIQFYKAIFYYQILKSFNLQIKDMWQNIEKVLDSLRESAEISKFANSLLEDKVNPMLLFVEQTDEMLYRLNMLLDITKEDVDGYSKDVKIQLQYKDGKNYNIADCFQGTVANERYRQLEKEAVLGDIKKQQMSTSTQEFSVEHDGQIDQKSPANTGESKNAQNSTYSSLTNRRDSKFTLHPKIDKSKLGSIKNFSMDRIEQQMGSQKATGDAQDGDSRHKEQNRINLELVGQKAWNQSKFYQLSYDRILFERSLKQVQAAVYFTDEPNIMDENFIRKKVAINLARRNRLSLLNDLQDFLFNEVGETISYLVNFYEIPLEDKLFFTFHLGAGHLSEMIKKYLVFKNLGICYIVTSGAQGNKIRKEFFPVLADDAVKRFWETRVNLAYDSSFDNFWEYSKISDIIRRKYQNELEIHRRKLDAIFSKMGNARNVMIQKENYFQAHFLEWFGLRNIYVYKRFVERSIFTHWNANDISSQKKVKKKTPGK